MGHGRSIRSAQYSRPVFPQSQPTGDIAKTTGPYKVPRFVRARLSYKLTSVWDTATAPAARTNRNFPRLQIASDLLGATRQPTDEADLLVATRQPSPRPPRAPSFPELHRRLAPARTRRCLYQKFCCGRLHRSLLGLYRPQSAVSCSTLRERAA